MKYTLSSSGKVPDFLYTGPYQIQGNASPSGLPSPQDWYLTGIAKDGAVGDFEVFATKQDLEDYLSVVGADWYIFTYEYNPIETDPETWDVGKYPFDPIVEANQIWANMEALNAN